MFSPSWVKVRRMRDLHSVSKLGFRCIRCEVCQICMLRSPCLSVCFGGTSCSPAYSLALHGASQSWLVFFSGGLVRRVIFCTVCYLAPPLRLSWSVSIAGRVGVFFGSAGFFVEVQGLLFLHGLSLLMRCLSVGAIMPYLHIL